MPAHQFRFVVQQMRCIRLQLFQCKKYVGTVGMEPRQSNWWTGKDLWICSRVWSWGSCLRVTYDVDAAFFSQFESDDEELS